MSATTETTIAEFRELVPGVYRGIPAAEYHLAIACSSTLLKRLHTHSPAHCFDLMTNPIEPSDEMDIGSAAHCLLFTPSEFDVQFVTAERCVGRIKGGEQCSRMGSTLYVEGWACSQHGKDCEPIEGVTVLSPDDMARVNCIAAAVRGNDTASQLLNAATDHELSIIATDPETGLILKARLDLWCGDYGILPDLKTCRSSDPKRFKYQARDLAYEVQLAFYRHVGRLAGLPIDIPTIIAVENTKPFPVTVFEPSDEYMVEGEKRMKAALLRFAECKSSGRWPGYTDKTQTLEII